MCLTAMEKTAMEPPWKTPKTFPTFPTAPTAHIQEKGTEMSNAYFTPWEGPAFAETNTLILSESAYDWTDEEGTSYTPQSSHPEDSIAWSISHFGENRYFTAMNRALSGEADPSPDAMRAAWDRHAYTIFVQRSVGEGAGVRPSKELWDEAGPHFLALLEQLQPQKVIITGKDMWQKMPECSVRLLDDLQAYRISGGRLVWCLAIPHPANRVEGFPWEKVAESIQVFEVTSFPLHLA